MGRSWPVGWSQARKRRARRQEIRSARAWLARSNASEEEGPVGAEANCLHQSRISWQMIEQSPDGQDEGSNVCW